MKIMKKIKATLKPSTKQIKVGSKKCARAKVDKKGNRVQESPTTIMHKQVSVMRPDHQKKSLKQGDKRLIVPDAQSMQKTKAKMTVKEDTPKQNIGLCRDDREIQ